MTTDQRIAGEAASEEARKQWPNKKLVDNIKRMIRCDYGGQDSVEITENRLVELLGEDAKYLSEHMKLRIAEAIVSLNEKAVAGIQKRVSHSMKEVSRRLDA